MSRSENQRRDVFAEHTLHMGAGFKEQERYNVLETLSGLGARLGRWDPNDVDVEASAQNRGGKEQRVKPRAWGIRLGRVWIPL